MTSLLFNLKQLSNDMMPHRDTGDDVLFAISGFEYMIKPVSMSSLLCWSALPRCRDCRLYKEYIGA